MAEPRYHRRYIGVNTNGRTDNRCFKCKKPWPCPDAHADPAPASAVVVLRGVIEMLLSFDPQPGDKARAEAVLSDTASAAADAEARIKQEAYEEWVDAHPERCLYRKALEALWTAVTNDGDETTLTLAAEDAEAALSDTPAQDFPPDMRAVVEALGFEPDNHHSAAKCPYCTPNQPQDSLSVAWEAAEAALPEGWKIERVGRAWLSGMGYLDRWQAIAVPSVRRGRDWRQKFVAANADTPAAALIALAAALRSEAKEGDK